MRQRRQSGSAVVEFSLAGVASIFLILCTVHLSIAMWNYHTLAYAVHQTSRFLAVKGVNCTKPGNSCSVDIGTIARRTQQFGAGLTPANLTLTLTTDSGAVTTCAPVTACNTNATIWPPSTNNDNRVDRKITVAGLYRFRSPLLFFWPGKGVRRFAAVWLPSSSTQRIIF